MELGIATTASAGKNASDGESTGGLAAFTGHGGGPWTENATEPS
jgi:hypothetical protein